MSSWRVKKKGLSILYEARGASFQNRCLLQCHFKDKEKEGRKGWTIVEISSSWIIKGTTIVKKGGDLHL